MTVIKSGADLCLEAFKDLQDAHPEKTITRDFYRKESGIAESVWEYHFGTFAELKRQAGAAPTRGDKKLLAAVAKHAEASATREDLSKERLGYANTYTRTDNSRYKTMIIAADLHDREIDPFYLRVLIDAAKRIQPDVISLAGDVFDLPEFGRFTVDPREWDAVGRIKFVHNNIFGPLRAAAPDAQMDLIEGNHECRLIKHLGELSPAMRSILGDLLDMSIADLFGLPKFKINYVAKADLKSFTERDHRKELEHNYRIYWNSLLVHHFPHARNMGMPGVNGHHHRHIVWSQHNVHVGVYEWHQLGAGHRRVASYTEGEKWQNGFMIAHVDTLTKTVNFEYIQITNFAVVGGQYYYREPTEIIEAK